MIVFYDEKEGIFRAQHLPHAFNFSCSHEHSSPGKVGMALTFKIEGVSSCGASLFVFNYHILDCLREIKNEDKKW